MKYILLIFMVTLAACSSLGTYQVQPVIALGENSFKTSCNGMAEGWDSCFRKAHKTCSNGYNVIEKTQLNDFVHREITFQCR